MLDSIPQPRSAGVTATTTKAEMRARSKEELRRRAKAVFTALDQQSHDASTMGSVGTTMTICDLLDRNHHHKKSYHH